MQQKPPSAPVLPSDDPQVLRVIRETADRHDVPRQIALAFAWCESRLNPRAEGDLRWHERDGGKLYRVRVLGNPRFVFNPARLVPERWHSYGLYQLLACYHTQADEPPEKLLDPVVNAERGIAEIKRLLHLAQGDVRATRLKYVGCGFNGTQCGADVVTGYVDKLNAALARYANEVRP